jgi:hypothetical protein
LIEGIYCTVELLLGRHFEITPTVPYLPSHPSTRKSSLPRQYSMLERKIKTGFMMAATTLLKADDYLLEKDLTRMMHVSGSMGRFEDLRARR